MMRKVFLLFLVFVCYLNSKAQTSSVYFDHIGIKEGLPEGLVGSIVEDREGYIWMSTQNGLVRYNGYEYKVYRLGSEKLNQHSSTSVVTIFIDNNKTMWVSTVDDGLFKYDRFTDSFQQFIYPIKYRCSFAINVADNGNNLWGIIYSDHTHYRMVVKFSISQGRYQLFSNWEKENNHINATYFYPPILSPNGGVWLPTNNGLYRYNGEGNPLTGYFTSTDTAKQITTWPLYQAKSQPNIFWMNTYHGKGANLKLISWNTRNNTIKDYPSDGLPFSISSDTIHSIYEDKKQQLWFATTDGLSKLERSTGRFFNYRPQDTVKSLAKNSLGALREDKYGDLWLSSPEGLVHFDPAMLKFDRFLPDVEKPGSLSSVRIRVKMIDHTNVLWVGLGFGVDKVDKIKSSFNVYKHNPAIPDSYPGGITIVKPSFTGNNWVISSGGVYQWKGRTEQFKKIYTPAAGEEVTDVCEGDNGELYIGTGSGLLVLDTNNGKKELYQNKPDANSTISSEGSGIVFKDHTGAIWLGSTKGISSFDPVSKKFTRYPYRTDRELTTPLDNGILDDGGIQSVYEDRENNLWVGSNHGGLNRFDRATGKFISYFTKANKYLHCVTSIFEDHSGRLWAGTAFYGVFEFDRKTGTCIRNIKETDGLIYNSVPCINESDGYLWVITIRGLSRIDQKSLKIKNFRVDHILPGNNIFEENNWTGKTGDARFVISLDNGLAVFDPKDLNDNPYPPMVHLEDVIFSNPLSDSTVLKRVIAYGHRSLDVAHDQNRIRFNYVALHYDDPQNNTYAYKLDGYDKQWIQAGRTRNVTYTNLPAGTYTFHVKAANSSGVWNNTGDSITIVIHPAWWATWWACLLYLVLFGSAVYAFIVYRSRQLIRENQLLEEKISVRTKQLNEQQKETVIQRDKLAETVTELKATQKQLIQSEKMASLGELTAGIAHEIQNPLNFVNNFSDVNREMIDELKEELEKGNTTEAIAIADDIRQNELKISHHGKRADFIVKGMLQHSRTSTGERQLTNINVLADEFLKLSYHGLRAKDKFFNAELVTHFDENLPKINIVQQDIGRVLLNLFNNAFYAVQQKQKTAGAAYKPEVSVSTSFTDTFLTIKVKDNGTGIPDSIKDKIMQPFFTTKPTGEGTGLGLSLSYDIVVKGHGGSININSEEGKGSEFLINLPLQA